MSTGGVGDDDDVPHAEWCLSRDPNDAPKKRRALNISRRRLRKVCGVDLMRVVIVADDFFAFFCTFDAALILASACSGYRPRRHGPLMWASLRRPPRSRGGHRVQVGACASSFVFSLFLRGSLAHPTSAHYVPPPMTIACYGGTAGKLGIRGVEGSSNCHIVRV